MVAVISYNNNKHSMQRHTTAKSVKAKLVNNQCVRIIVMRAPKTKHTLLSQSC